MESHDTHDHHVKRILLPSGKTIEVVYFSEREAAGDPVVTPSQEPSRGLHVCPDCDAGLVHPTDWSEAGKDHWRVAMRCPNCEWSGSGVFSQELVDLFDEQLDEGTDALVRDLKRLTRANMEDEIEWFVSALQADAILPEDF
jgi:hypothetical protein